MRNNEQTIGKTFQSIVDQEFEAVESVVIDGASMDDTLAIIEDYQVKFKARGLSMRVTSGPDTGWLWPLKRLKGRIVQAVLRLGRH